MLFFFLFYIEFSFRHNNKQAPIDSTDLFKPFAIILGNISIHRHHFINRSIRQPEKLSTPWTFIRYASPGWRKTVPPRRVLVEIVPTSQNLNNIPLYFFYNYTFGVINISTSSDFALFKRCWRTHCRCFQPCNYLPFFPTSLEYENKFPIQLLSSITLVWKCSSSTCVVGNRYNVHHVSHADHHYWQSSQW